MVNIKRFRADFNIQVVTLLLIIIQSFGIRFFNGQGSFLSIVIIGLSFKGLINLRKNDFVILFWIGVFFAFNKMANPEFQFSKLFFQFVLILEAIICLKQYSNYDKLSADLSLVLKIIFLHSIVGYFLFLIIPFAFQTVTFEMSYKSLFNIFFVSNSRGIARNTGICWEPGLLQLILNLLLFFSIKNNNSKQYLLLVPIGIITTFSTTGFIILFLNYLYYLLTTVKKRKTLLPLIFVTLLALIPFSILQNNILDKLGGTNTSGLVRYRDYLIGLKLIAEKPILGHGVFDSQYLLSKSYVSQIELGIFTEGYLNTSGELSGGYTNGLLGLLCWYGLPAGILCYILLFKNKIIKDETSGRVIFFLILMLSFLSEPITYTAFFLIFPFSYFINVYKGKAKSQLYVSRYH